MSDDDLHTATVEVDADHPAFDGHFPGRPILPGVALIALVLEAAAAAPRIAAAIGPAPRLVVAKFLAPVAPGTTLAIALRASAAAIDWQIAVGRSSVASGRFARSDGASRDA